MVGKAIATKLVELGHEVMMGSRTADNERAASWVASAGEQASQGTFADAAAHGELVFNCTAGEASLEAIGSARTEDLAGKVLVDVSNPLDHSRGMPPGLFVSSFGQPRRADPARIPRRAGGEGAEHGELRGHGRPGQGARRARRVRVRDDEAAKARSSSSCRASAGRRSTSSTSGTSRPRGAPRRTSCSGSASGGLCRPATSTCAWSLVGTATIPG